MLNVGSSFSLFSEIQKKDAFLLVFLQSTAEIHIETAGLHQVSNLVLETKFIPLGVNKFWLMLRFYHVLEKV